jgi:hypothetical protein
MYSRFAAKVPHVPNRTSFLFYPVPASKLPGYDHPIRPRYLIHSELKPFAPTLTFFPLVFLTHVKERYSDHEAG